MAILILLCDKINHVPRDIDSELYFESLASQLEVSDALNHNFMRSRYLIFKKNVPPNSID